MVDRVHRLARLVNAYLQKQEAQCNPALDKVLDEFFADSGTAFPVAERIVEAAGELSVGLALEEDHGGEREAVARMAVVLLIKVVGGLMRRGIAIEDIELELDRYLIAP